MSEVPQERNQFRWAILAFISVSHIVGAGAQYGISSLAPFYQDELQLSRAQVGLFFSAFYLAMTGASFFAGWLADRFGVRKTILQGHLALGLFTITASFAPSFMWAFASFFMAGLGYSSLNPSSSKGVMAWFNRDERATAMGIKQTGVPAGGVFAAVLAGPLVLIVGWRGALAILGIVNLFYGVVFAWLWRDPVKRMPETTLIISAAEEMNTHLEVRSLAAASFGTAIFFVGQMVLITYVPLYLKECIGISAYWASQALALMQLGAVVGRTGWGIVSDRLFGGRRKLVLIIVGVLGALLSGALSLTTKETPLYLLLITIFLSGLCLIGYQGVSFALIGEIAGTFQAGMATGIMISVNAVAATLGTPLFGHFVDRTGSYLLAWQVLASTIAIGVVILALLLKESRPAS
jgi:MFS transporter, ACS family, hexuronate transporter